MNKYLEERAIVQREWYEAKASENKKLFIKYQTIIIILGAVIPVLVVFESVVPFLNDYGGPITALISAAISIFAALDKLIQPQPNWFNYRANEESLKKEEWWYKYLAGPYKGMSSEKADIMFIERVENIISSDIARTASIDSKEENGEGSKVSRASTIDSKRDNKPQ